jgi:hypothetical protein
MTTNNQNPAQRLNAALASLEYLSSAQVEEISQVIQEYVGAVWEDKARQLVEQEIAKLQSGIEHTPVSSKCTSPRDDPDLDHPHRNRQVSPKLGTPRQSSPRARFEI